MCHRREISGLSSLTSGIWEEGGREHLDITFRGWSSTLAAGVRLVISRLVLIFALLLDFHGRIRVVRSMYLPAALHGIEASLLASDSLAQSFVLLSIGWFGLVVSLWLVLVLSLACWMGPLGVILHFAWCGFGFVCFVGILLFGHHGGWSSLPSFGDVGEGSPGHGPVHFLSASAAEVGFSVGSSQDWVGLDLGCLCLSNLAGPIQHFRAAVLDAWRNKVAADLCGREGFRGGPLLDVSWLLAASLILLMSGRETRLCFVKQSWLGVSGMVFFLEGFGSSLFHVGFVVHLMVMVIFFGNVPFLLLLRYVKILRFMISWEWIRVIGHRCLLWHGWLPYAFWCQWCLSLGC